MEQLFSTRLGVVSSACVAATVLLASSAQAHASPTTVVITMTDSELKLAPSSVPAGSVVFKVVNKGKTARDFRIAGKRTVIIPAGKSATLQADFVKRPYRYFSIGRGRTAPLSGFLGVLESCTNPTASTTVAVKITLGVITLSQTTVPCGTVTFVVTNIDPDYIHDFKLSIVTVVNSDVFGPRLRPGQTASMTVNFHTRAPSTIGARRRSMTRAASSATSLFNSSARRGLPSMPARSIVRWNTIAALAVGALASSASSVSASGLPLRTVARIALSGPAVRFDYTSLDPTTNRLWISHMNANHLLAFDVRSHKIVKTIPAPGVHGVIAVPALSRVYASATNARQVWTIDSKTGSVLARAPAGAYPDGLAYDPVERHVFISDESGGVETVVDSRGRWIATIALGGEAGNVQYDSGSRRILVAVQTRNDIAVIDPRTNRVVRRVALSGCVGDHGLLVDSTRRLAFVACDHNATLLTLDLRTMNVTGTSSTGRSPDVLAFDSSLRRLYVAAESGEVAVFAETAHGLRKLAQAFLSSAAHTVAVDSRTHLVYFPLQSGSNRRPELLIMKPSPT